MNIMELSKKTDRRGYLRIRVPTRMPEQDMEVVMLIQPAPSKRPAHRKYDFSKVAGKLKWRGDALREQKRLRDEW